jgi:WD40 repeat protein
MNAGRCLLFLVCALLLMACNLTNLFEARQVSPFPPVIPGVKAAATPSLPTAAPAVEPSVTTVPRVIEPENAAQVRQVQQVNLNNPFGLNWSGNSQQIGAMTPDGLKLFDAASLNLESSVQVQSPFSLLDFSVDAGLMAITSDQQTIELRDLRTGAVRATLSLPSTFFTAVFSNDGKTLAVPLTDQVDVEMYQTDNGQKSESLTGFQAPEPVYGVSFARGRGHFLIWISRATVQVMNLQTHQMGALLSHEDFVGGVALSPDGKTLAVATSGTINNQTEPLIQLWDAQNGKDLGKISSGDFVTASLDFSPDGRLLVGGRNNTAVIWDPAALKELKVLGGHLDRINSIRFSPDGTQIASSGADGVLKFWSVVP